MLARRNVRLRHLTWAMTRAPASLATGQQHQAPSQWHPAYRRQKPRNKKGARPIYVAVFSGSERQNDLNGAEKLGKDGTARRPDARRDVVSIWRKQFLPAGLRGWGSALVRAAPRTFPPEVLVQVKARACELPASHELPSSCWSTSDLVREMYRSGLVALDGGAFPTGKLNSAATT